ncbi:hypothetical protein ACFQZZ_14865 [Nocardia sp. GCM10030253]|uniref:hypothetical protein n=1 Tax=Nocardia sp. GCM10030253 TaxID=3273404 RepID=UPI00363E9E76
MNQVPDSSIHRTPDELRTIYLLYPQVRDVVTEGRGDLRFVQNFLSNYPDISSKNVNVYAVCDRINLPDSDVIDAGFESGQRGRVLTLAMHASAWSDQERAGLTCIADADRAHLARDFQESDVLLVTDYASIEGYAFSERVISKFLLIVLSVDAPTGSELMSKAYPILSSLFVARAALHWSGTGESVPDKFIKRSSMNHAGLANRLFEQIFPGNANLSLREKLLARVDELNSLISPNDRRFVRGHDIAEVMIVVLDPGRKWSDPEVVEGALMGCIECADIESEPLFTELLRRLRS